MNEIDDRIGRYLEDRATLLELTPASPGRAVRRARQRQARRRLAGVVSVGLAAALIGNQLATRGDGGTVVADQPAMVFDGPALQWQRQDPAGTDAALGYNGGIVGAAGELYALSTAPGRWDGDGIVAQALYRSADGVAWATSGRIEEGRWLGSLTSQGGTLYALSTGAGYATGVSLSTSGDGGATWAANPLPIDLGALEAQTSQLHLGGTSVAAHGSGVVVALRVSATVDPAAVLPPGAAPHGVHATAEGLEILGPVREGQPLLSYTQCEGGTVVRLTDDQRAALERERADGVETPMATSTYGCQWDDGNAGGVGPIADDAVAGPPVDTVSWAELGASDDLRLAATSTLRVFSSADGVTFTEAVLPAPVVGWGSNELIATADGYLLVAQSSSADGPGSTRTLVSSDGITWTRGADLPSAGWGTQVGRLGDRIGVVVRSGEGSTLALGDGEGWTTVALPGNGGGLGGVAFGLAGVAIASYGPDDDAIGGQVLLTSPDGETWTRTELRDLLPAPRAGLRHLAVTAAGVVLTFDVPGEGVPTATAVLVGSMG